MTRAHITSLLLLALAGHTPAHAEDCPDSSPILMDAEQEVVNFYLTEAKKSLSRAVEAIGCGDPVTPEVVARVLRIEGVLSVLEEDEDGATAAFAVARELEPDHWNEDFGERAKALFDAAVPPPGEDALLRLRNLAGGEWVTVDGESEKAPYKLAPGVHFIQVGSPDGPARFARVVEMPAGQTVELSLPEAPTEPEPPGDIQVIAKKGGLRAPWLLASGSGSYGGRAQVIEDAGTFLDDRKQGEVVISGTTSGHMPLSGDFAAQWDVSVSTEVIGPATAAAVGVSYIKGQAAILGGIQIQSAAFVEGSTERIIPVIVPQAGVFFLGKKTDFEARAAFVPWAMGTHMRAGYAVMDLGPVAVRIGVEVAAGRVYLIENKPGERRMSASSWRAGGQVGFLWRG